MAIHRVDLGDVQAEDWHDQGVDAGHAGYEYCATLREAKRRGPTLRSVRSSAWRTPPPPPATLPLKPAS